MQLRAFQQTDELVLKVFFEKIFQVLFIPRLPNDNVGHACQVRVRCDHLGKVFPIHRHNLGTELLGKVHIIAQQFALLGCELGARLHIQRFPLGVVGLGHTRAYAQVFSGRRRGRKKHEQSFAHALLHRLPIPPIDTVRRAAHRYFTQGREVLPREKVVHRRHNPLGPIDFAFLEAF